MKTAIAFLILTSGLVAADDNYERSRQCAAQAEKMARRKELHLLQSHYSPKYQKCFMTAIPPGNRYRTFEDAYEGSVLVNEYYDPADGKEPSCRIWNASKRGWEEKPCSEYHAYVEEHMSQ